jgi:hypothetical protein
MSYHRCPRCKFLQTDEPFWLEEAHSEAMGDFDMSLLARAEKAHALSNQ